LFRLNFSLSASSFVCPVQVVEGTVVFCYEIVCAASRLNT
jgi:hypothetical protein